MALRETQFGDQMITDEERQTMSSQYRGTHGHFPGCSQYGPVQILDGHAHLGDIYNNQYHYHVANMFTAPGPDILFQQQQRDLLQDTGNVHRPIDVASAKDVLSRLRNLMLERAGLQRIEPIVQKRLTFEAQLSTAINQWLASRTKRFAYIEYRTGSSGPRIDLDAGAQIAEVATSAGFPAIFEPLSLEQAQSNSSVFEADDYVRYTLLTIINRVLSLLDDRLALDPHLSSALYDIGRCQLPRKPDVGHCGRLLKDVLNLAPPNLCLVIVMHPAALADADESMSDVFSNLVLALRHACEEGPQNLRVLILTQHNIPLIVKCLTETEIKLVIASAKGKAAHLPLLIRCEI